MSEVDISELRMNEGPAPRRPAGPRVAVGVVALVVVAVAASFLLPILLPRRPVTTAAVRAAGTEEGARVMTAEAAGWVEPDPYAIIVRPLVSGVLEELAVLEGHEVKNGETLIGRLRSAPLEAARDRAKAKLALEEENLRHRIAELKVAESLLDQRADLRLSEALARHEVTLVDERIAAARGELEAAQAERDGRKADLDGQRKLKEAGGSYPVALAKTEAALRAAEARVAKRKHELDALGAELAQDRATLEIAKELLDDPRDLTGAVVIARSNVGHREAMRNAARTELEIAQRQLDWATVKAPVDGIVLKLLASPGDVVGPEAHGLVSIYDAGKLQARVDVPLASMEGVRVGQEVEVSSEVLGGRKTRGKVLRIQRESDLLKNTLQVKVQLIDPDPLLRPETLCRARFLAPKEEEAAGATTLFRVPAGAVRGGAVYILDPGAGRARRVPVKEVGRQNGDVVVRGALSITQEVILDEVEADERVERRS